MIEIKGCGTALVTPFQSSGGVDLDAYRAMVQWQIEEGINFLVPCGTTGESVTLSEREYGDVIRCCLETASGRVSIVAGAGTNDTRQAINLARIAESEGVDAILSVAPYYNKPTQEGIFQHFRSIADSVDIPMVLYNVPGRTGTNILPSTVFRLAQVQNIIGLKEAGGDLAQIMNLLSHRPPSFSIFSGDDNIALALSCLGGQGVISVASNIIPSEMSEMIKLAGSGDLEQARQIHYRYLRLMNLNFLESNPMCPMSEINKAKIDRELEKLDLMSH